jgi:hypothetical protein
MKDLTLAVKVGELQQKIKEQGERICMLTEMVREFSELHKAHMAHQKWVEDFAKAVADDMGVIDRNFKKGLLR